MILFLIISVVILLFLCFYFYKETRHFDHSKERKQLINKLNDIEKTVNECKQILKM